MKLAIASFVNFICIFTICLDVFLVIRDDETITMKLPIPFRLFILFLQFKSDVELYLVRENIRY